MPEITDEDFLDLKNCYNKYMESWQNPILFTTMLGVVSKIIYRLESERPEETQEIGPDALGIYAQGILDKTAHMAFLQLKRNISTFLKGRMEKWEAEIDAFPIYSQWLKNIITEIKHIHEALCGEVKDEQE